MVPLALSVAVMAVMAANLVVVLVHLELLELEV
jgi:hypothetical protein